MSIENASEPQLHTGRAGIKNNIWGCGHNLEQQWGSYIAVKKERNVYTWIGKLLIKTELAQRQ